MFGQLLWTLIEVSLKKWQNYSVSLFYLRIPKTRVSFYCEGLRFFRTCLRKLSRGTGVNMMSFLSVSLPPAADSVTPLQGISHWPQQPLSHFLSQEEVVNRNFLFRSIAPCWQITFKLGRVSLLDVVPFCDKSGFSQTEKQKMDARSQMKHFSSVFSMSWVMSALVKRCFRLRWGLCIKYVDTQSSVCDQNTGRRYHPKFIPSL